MLKNTASEAKPPGFEFQLFYLLTGKIILSLQIGDNICTHLIWLLGGWKMGMKLSLGSLELEKISVWFWLILPHYGLWDDEHIDCDLILLKIE